MRFAKRIYLPCCVALRQSPQALHPQFAQAGMAGRPGAGASPEEFALILADRDVVDAGFTPPHQAVIIELPLLVPIGTVPIAGIIVPFVLKTHRNAIGSERPQLLNQAVVQFASPFSPQKFNDCMAAFEELGPITPSAILAVRA